MTTSYRVHVSSRFGDFTQDIEVGTIGLHKESVKKAAAAVAKCVLGRVVKIEKLA
jgi:hypothetical protein